MRRAARTWLAKCRGAIHPPLAHRPDRCDCVSMIKRVLGVIVFGVALYLLIPRLGGLSRDAAALRNANVWLALLGVAAEAASIAAYITLYRSLLRAEHIEVPRLATGVEFFSARLMRLVYPCVAPIGTVGHQRDIEGEGGY